MIRRQGKKSILECDECGDEYTEHAWTETQFREMIAEAKRDGWVIGKDPRDNWTHVCSACAPKKFNGRRRSTEEMFGD